MGVTAEINGYFSSMDAMVLIQKNWNYTLTTYESKLILSVLCGRSALYELNILLNEAETEKFNQLGEVYIDSLAELVRNDPDTFSARK